jgi:hypothetical protein
MFCRRRPLLVAFVRRKYKFLITFLSKIIATKIATSNKNETPVTAMFLLIEKYWVVNGLGEAPLLGVLLATIWLTGSSMGLR